MSMIEKILVLSVTPYDFEDQNTREVRQGITLFACHLNSDQTGNTKGCKPVKYSLPLEMKTLFDYVKIPAFCDMEWNFDFNRMKPQPNNFKDFIPLSDLSMKVKADAK